MSTAALRATIEAAHTARIELDNQRERARKLEADLGPAKATLEQAEAELTACLGADTLGEGKAQGTKKARAARDDASERVRGITSALTVLRARDTDAEAACLRLERDARAIAAPIARVLADEEIKRARRLFESACSALSTWHALNTLANGSETTGHTQARESAIGPILKTYGIWVVGGELLLGREDGSTRPMSALDFLAFIPDEAQAAQ